VTARDFILAALATAIGSLIAFAVVGAVAKKYADSSLAEAKQTNLLAKLFL
jgi:hypothetical protein